MTRLGKFSIALACVLAALAGGMWLGGHPEELPEALRDAFVDDERALRAEVMKTIEDNYYKKVDEQKLEDASIAGVVRSLRDRFSHYFPPREARLFAESVSGSFEGIGMTVQENRRGLRVVSVFDDSPAAKAGLHVSDLITRVNGESLAGKSTDIATAKIKGRAGTSVTITVLNPETKRSRDLKVKRARIEVPIVEARLREQDGVKLGVVKLATFSSGAHGKLRQDVDRLLDRGADGIVLDLRGNGGGLLQEAVLVSSIFIEDGLVVSTRGRRKPERKFTAQGDAIADQVPVVVMVDRGSASASEIVAGALKDRRRATIVGARTFGKGVFQEVEPLSNGGALNLTVGSYYLPNGENISNRGVTPTVRARDLPRTRRDEALPVALETLREKLR